MEKLRVGVIGRTTKGNYGHGIDTVWADIPPAEVVAVADEHEAGRKEAQARTKAPRAYADYREMLDKEKLQLVAIGPRWVDQHRDLAIAAISSGCHIYMEKPFVRTLEEADEVVQACEMRHTKLALAHQTRYSPTVQMARKLLLDGAIGQVLELRGRGKEDQRGGGEDLWVLGSHIVDLMRFFAGDARDCTAMVTTKGEPIRAADVSQGNEGIGLLAGDAVHARYTFAGGVLGSFDSVRGQAGTPSRFALQVYGSKGVLEIEFGYPAAVWILKDPGWSPGRSGANWQPVSSQGIGQAEKPGSTGIHAGNVAAVTDLLNAIKDSREPLCGMYDGRGTIEMIAGVFASQVEGRPVNLPLKSRGNPLAQLR